MKLKAALSLLVVCFGSIPSLSGITISEKKAGLVDSSSDFDPETQKLLEKVNQGLQNKYTNLQSLYEKAQKMYSQGEPLEKFRDLLYEIRELKLQIKSLELQWRNNMLDKQKGERYALWHQPATTIEQLVIDFGSQEFVYIIPPDIAKKEISVASSIAIPKAMWTDMLEQLLAQQGVGYRQLNPYLRQLFLTKDDLSGIRLITNNRDDLHYYSGDERVGFVLTPEATVLKRVAYFIEKFINPSTTSVQVIGRNIFIASTVHEMKELLKLYDFASANRNDRDYKLITLQKVEAEEMAKILEGLFEQFEREEEIKDDAGKVTTKRSRDEFAGGLKVIPLSEITRAVFLVGTKEEIVRAETIIKEVEAEVGLVRGKVIYSYKVKHSNPEELANVLNLIYNLLLEEKQSKDSAETTESRDNIAKNESSQTINVVAPRRPPRRDLFSTGLDDTRGFYLDDYSTGRGFDTGLSGIASARPVQPALDTPIEYNQGRNNFIVEPKTSMMVMVVEPDVLPKLRDLLKKIDVPKKMVQLDVLLFEKRITTQEEIGLNLLRVGGRASNSRLTSVVWNDVANTSSDRLIGDGILTFFLSRMRGHGIPAYDLAYRFLMTQDDVTINANPTVLTLNQSPAFIAIVEELSINTGVVEISSAGGPQSKDSFTRAQYGTILRIVPTIHMRDETDYLNWDPDEPDYITLETDVNFDTPSPTSTDPSRPNIIRRNIKNFTRVPDGKTVILGGLRRKDTFDGRDAIPFLGEIPCVGKAFSTNRMSDNSTEMFIFITPTIVDDPCEDLEKVRMEQLARRPGDIPEFMCELQQARCREKHRCFAQGMKMLFDRRPDRCVEWGEDSCNLPRSRHLGLHNGNYGVEGNSSAGYSCSIR